MKLLTVFASIHGEASSSGGGEPQSEDEGDEGDVSSAVTSDHEGNPPDLSLSSLHSDNAIDPRTDVSENVADAEDKDIPLLESLAPLRRRGQPVTENALFYKKTKIK